MRTIQRKVSGARLASRRGGPFQIAEPFRRLIAVFDNGVVCVAREERWSAGVKGVLESARTAGLGAREVIETSVEIIVELYKDHQQPGEGVDLQIRRQAELAELIQQAAAMKSSDLRLRVTRDYTEIMCRVHGRAVQMGTRTRDDGLALIRAALAVASDQGTHAADTTFQQGALTEKSGLLPRRVDLIRLQYTPTSDGLGSLSMRLKERGQPGESDVAALGYNARQVADLATMRRRTNGLYMLSGKVSSGKTQTLQRCLNQMYQEKRKEITVYTIEEPVELDLPFAVQVPARISLDGRDGFSEAMKASLRSDPNVIVLGEVRSAETAQLAVHVATTGHALWSTIHAASALGILDRLLDLGIEMDKLKDPSIVRGLVYQRLVGVLCPACRVSYAEAMGEQIDPDLAREICDLTGIGPDLLYLRGPGCPSCAGGLVGRTVVAEVILTDLELLSLFAERRYRDMRRHWLTPTSEGGLGGMPVLHHALTKVGLGICDINEIEEEVDLVSSYRTHHGSLIAQLRKDVAEARREQG
jgi:general secretion pathway protein E